MAFNCGNSMEPAEAIEETGLVYMPDIHSSLTVYPEESTISVPVRLTCRRNAFSQSTVLKKTGRFWAWTGGGHGIIG